MQDTPAPKRPGCCADRVYAQRKCEDCPVVFIPLSSGQKRCADCQEVHNRKLNRERQNAKNAAKRKPRYCADCGAEIPHKGRSRPRIRCEVCAPIHNAEHNRQRKKALAPEVRKVYARRYLATHREQALEANRKYKQEHPEIDQASIHRRRQRREVGMDEVDRLLSTEYRRAIRHDPCFYCGKPEAREVDHFFPLSKGGTDHFFNLVRCCWRCNRGRDGKHDMCGTAFMLQRGFLP